MRVAFSATAGMPPLLVKETVFLRPIVDCPEPEIVDQEWEFPSGVLVALALASILRCLCFSRVEPATLRVRCVRQNHSEDVRAERLHVAQSRISKSSCRIPLSWIVSSIEFWVGPLVTACVG